MRSLLHHPYMLEYAGLSEATAKSPLVFHHCPSKKKGHFTTSIDIPPHTDKEIWMKSGYRSKPWYPNCTLKKLAGEWMVIPPIKKYRGVGSPTSEPWDDPYPYWSTRQCSTPGWPARAWPCATSAKSSPCLEFRGADLEVHWIGCSSFIWGILLLIYIYIYYTHIYILYIYIYIIHIYILYIYIYVV